MAITGDFLIFSVALTYSVILCVALSKWYVWPALDRRPKHEALILILWPHTSRFINLAAATVSQVDPRVPHAWTLEIAYGDFIAAVLALLAIAVLRSGSKAGYALAWLATLWGLADFGNSLVQGTLLGVIDLPLRAVWYIAAAAVPMLTVAHILAIRLLRKPD